MYEALHFNFQISLSNPLYFENNTGFQFQQQKSSILTMKTISRSVASKLDLFISLIENQSSH